MKNKMKDLLAKIATSVVVKFVVDLILLNMENLM